MKKNIPILMVDDRPENLLAIEAVLSSTNYKLVRANSGQEALKYLIDHDCAVILMDVQMPIMDGFETALKIRLNPKTRNTPIIFLTASIEDKDKIFKGYEAGAIDYIFKPFEPNILRSKVQFFAELYKRIYENKIQADLLKVQAEDNVSAVLENALDAVVSMNAEGFIIYWNSKAVSVFGWTKEEALGMKMSKLIIPQNFRQMHENGLKEFLISGKGPILGKRIEVSALNKNGNEFPIELSVTPVLKENVFTFTAFVRDISDRMLLEKERKAKEESLQEALASRDHFISICSHELNTPVTSMKLQFQMAQRRIQKGDEKVFDKDVGTKRISLACSQLDRMTRLINDMLDVTKINSGKLEMNLEVLKFGPLVEEVIERFREQLEFNEIELQFSNSLTDEEVKGDQLRLEQVISNLITNAVKYGKNNPIRVSVGRDNQSVTFLVQDQGMGIDKINQERVFNKFERGVSASNISGLGLGLYIAKQIIDSHNGTIKIDSEVEKGSTFLLKIPIL